MTPDGCGTDCDGLVALGLALLVAASATAALAVVPAGEAVRWGTGPTDRDAPGQGADDSTTAESGGDVAVEYLNCSAVRVTGDGSVRVRVLGFYDAGEYFRDVERSVNGTTVIRAPPDDDLLTSDRGFISYVDPTGGSSADAVTNPRRDECRRQFRPAPVETYVVDATRTDEGSVATESQRNGGGEAAGGTYRVTFGYRNPNDYPLQTEWDYDSVARQFSLLLSNHDDPAERQDLRDGPAAYPHANRTPPTELRPGEHTFTVEWTPTRGDARLVWLLDLEYFRFDDPTFRAVTAPADRIPDPNATTAPAEPATTEAARLPSGLKGFISDPA